MSRALFPPSWEDDQLELDLAPVQPAPKPSPHLAYSPSAVRQYEANLEALRTGNLAHYTGWADPQVRALAFDAVGTPKREVAEACAQAGIDPLALVSPASLSAFQTPPAICVVVWELALKALGRAPRAVLEPAAGMGGFLEAAPSMGGFKLAIEPDPVMSRHLQVEHSDWRARAITLERAGLVAPSFDLVIGGLPFGEWGVRDEECCASLRRASLQHRVSDWMLCRVVSLLVVGGVAAVLVERMTLDRETSPAREWLFGGASGGLSGGRAELLGAWRLGSVWGREVVDLVVLRRTRAAL